MYKAQVSQTDVENITQAGVFKPPNEHQELLKIITEENQNYLTVTDKAKDKQELAIYARDRIKTLKQIVEKFSILSPIESQLFPNKLQYLDEGVNNIAQLVTPVMNKKDLHNSIPVLLVQFTRIKTIFQSIRGMLDQHQPALQNQQIHQQLVAQVKNMDDFISVINNFLMHVDQQILESHFSMTKLF